MSNQPYPELRSGLIRSTQGWIDDSILPKSRLVGSYDFEEYLSCIRPTRSHQFYCAYLGVNAHVQGAAEAWRQETFCLGDVSGLSRRHQRLFQRGGETLIVYCFGCC